MRADGSGLRRLTEDAAYDGEPATHGVGLYRNDGPDEVAVPEHLFSFVR